MEFPRRVLELFPGNVDRDILIVVTLTIIALAIWRRRAPRDDDALQRRASSSMLIVLGVTYCMLPYQITRPMSWWYVSPRVPSMMAVLLRAAAGAAASIRGRRRLMMLPIVVCAIILPLTLSALYRDFSRRNAPFMQPRRRDAARARTVLVVVRGMMRGPGSEELSGDPATSAPGLLALLVVADGAARRLRPYIFDQGIPIEPKLKLTAPAWANTDTFEMRQAPEFDYYLVRNPSDEMEREPSLKVQERLGEWVLFKRIHKMTDEP